ncbi:MAG TPA: hypothetical protein VFZ23_00165 [Pyrinomonadaceae bacterium]
MSDNLDEIRKATLNQIESSEARYKLAFVGAAMIEAVFLVLFLVLADLSDRVHLLLLIAAIATYTIVGFGLIALGLHVNRNTLRLIRAIEMLGRGKQE